MAITADYKGIGDSNIPYLVVWTGGDPAPAHIPKMIYGNTASSITAEHKGIDGVNIPYVIGVDEEGNEIG